MSTDGPGPDLPEAPPPGLVRPLREWLAASHLAVLILPIIGLVVSGALAQDLVNQTRWDLEHQATLLAMLAEEAVVEARRHDPGADLSCCTEALSEKLRFVKAQTLAGIEMTNARGVVVATSGSALGEDLSSQPHVRAALGGRTKLTLKPRPPPSARQALSGPSRRARVRVFVAQPAVVAGQVVGTVVISRTPREEVQALYHMAPRAAWAGLVAIGITLAVAWGAGVLATRSLTLLDRGAVRIAEGDYEGLSALAAPQRSHVAEVSRVASSVARMATRLRERLGYIGEFASNVSHEFKTPLATLRGTVELLADDEGMPQDQRERFLGNAAHEVDRLEALVEGLLSLARADLAVRRERLSLLAVVRRATGDEVEVVGPDATVHGDPAQLDAVVANLVDNAREHGGSGVTVRVEAWQSDERAGFDVIDDGAGISAANLARVFDRFFTTDRAGGTGLGLALVRAIVEQHGGSVAVESVPGRTVFRVELPRASEVEPDGQE